MHSELKFHAATKISNFPRASSQILDLKEQSLARVMQYNSGRSYTAKFGLNLYGGKLGKFCELFFIFKMQLIFLSFPVKCFSVVSLFLDNFVRLLTKFSPEYFPNSSRISPEFLVVNTYAIRGDPSKIYEDLDQKNKFQIFI